MIKKTATCLVLALLLGACAPVVPPPVRMVETAPAPRLVEGARALASGDAALAMRTWETFLREAPKDPREQEVRGYLTLLRRMEARNKAKQMVAEERNLSTPDNAGLVVALFPFDNVVYSTKLGAKRPFNQAVIAMVTADLAKAPGVTIVEREQLRALQEELQLSASQLADPKSRLRLGRLLGANHVVSGLVEDNEADHYNEGTYKIVTALARVADGNVLGVQEAAGKRGKFFELQKEIVFEILEGLGVRDIPPEIARYHTQNWDAYAEFAEGLRMIEEGHFREARETLARAIALDPAFALARETLENTPAQAVTPEEMAKRLAP